MQNNTASGYLINSGLRLQHRVFPHPLGMRKAAFDKIQIQIVDDRHRVLNSKAFVFEYQRRTVGKGVTISLQLSQDGAMG